MPPLHVSYVAAANPAGLPPVTVDDLWACLERKVRRPTEFVPAISACTVHSDTATRVVRTVTLQTAAGPVQLHEECELQPPRTAVFVRDDGSRVVNSLEGDGADLLVRYSFWWQSKAAAGTAELEAERAQTEQMGRMAVHKLIEGVREMGV